LYYEEESRLLEEEGLKVGIVEDTKKLPLE
jgi:hypothetical protein